MRLHIWVYTAIIISLALACEASSMEIGGGAQMSIGPDSSVAGSFQADSAGASADVYSGGAATNFSESHFVEDSSGKRAEIYFSVTGAAGSFDHKAKFVPGEGSVPEAAKVSATQTVKVAKADKIELHTAARSSDHDVAGANLTLEKAGTTQASFSGSMTSFATDSKASSQVQGKVMGAVNGTAGFGGSSITGPYTTNNTRDSLGKKVEGSLDLQASSEAGTGTLKGVSAFSVDAAKGETIQGAVDASWKGGTINVAKGTYRENIAIDDSLTLKGAGAGKTVVDGNRSGSAVTIPDSSSSVSLSGMTVQNGRATNGGGILSYGTLLLSGVTLTGNYASHNGGAVYSNGSATLDKVTISGNSASENGGGIDSVGTLTATNSKFSENSVDGGGRGGAICSSGDMYMDKSDVSRNFAGDGGAVYSDGNVTMINSSTISRNSAMFKGGGIHSAAGLLTVSKDTVSDNFARQAGGIYSVNSIIIKSTVSGNSAKSTVGGIQADGTSNITGCTISGNNGGGVYGAVLNVEDSTIKGNIGGSGSGISGTQALTVTRSKITGNRGGTQAGGIFSQGTATITDSTISDNSGLDNGGICSYGRTTITRSKITGNRGGYSAGGIFVGSKATITDSTISGNIGAVAGGIYHSGMQPLSLTKSTISKNSGSYGGGILIMCFATLTDCTVASNYASIFGGGICSGGFPSGYQTPGMTTVINSTISGNTAARTEEAFAFTRTIWSSKGPLRSLATLRPRAAEEEYILSRMAIWPSTAQRSR